MNGLDIARRRIAEEAKARTGMLYSGRLGIWSPQLKRKITLAMFDFELYSISFMIVKAFAMLIEVLIPVMPAS